MLVELNERTEHGAQLVERTMRRAVAEGWWLRVYCGSGYYVGRAHRWDGEAGYLEIIPNEERGHIIEIDVLRIERVEVV